MPEPTGVREFNVLDLSGELSNGFVKVDNFPVRMQKGSKKLNNVFRILLEFVRLVRESGCNGRGTSIPSNGPVTMGLDGFGWFASANREIEISDQGGNLIIGEGGEKPRKDDVKVDRRSGQNILPLGFGERRE